MTVFYQIFSSENQGSGATILFNEGPVPVDSSHPNYAAIIELLTSNPQGDEQAIRDLVNPGQGVSNRLRTLSERVSWDGTNILFDGDVVHNAITNHIVRILETDNEDSSYSALVAFLEKLAQNSSEKSRDSLYEFILRHEIVIDNDGDFYVYKGVNADGSSIHAGYGIVNGVVIPNGNLMNTIGSILEMPRSRVNADTSVGCSTGLHAGSYAYASRFSRGKLLTVKVNPRDVVSVPDDCHFQKIRVSRYKVTGIADHEIASTTFSYGADDVDRHTITELENLLESYDEVEVDFTYRNGNGDTSEVSAAITGTLVNREQKLVLLGENGNSWLFENITDLQIDQELLDDVYGYDDDYDYDDDEEDDSELTGDVTENLTHLNSATTADLPIELVDVEEADDRDPETRLRELVDNGAEVYINFDYTKINNETRHLEGFLAQEIRATNTHGQDLISGIRAEDEEERVYRMDRITNLTFVGAVETLDAEESTEDAVLAIIESGDTVRVSFSYTSAQGNTRAVENVTVTEVRDSARVAGELLLVGRRPEDTADKTYRLDRVADLVIV